MVGPAVGDAIQQVLEAAPNAYVFVLGYPDILPTSPTGLLWPLSCLPTSAAISSEERDGLRTLQRSLNEEIEARTNAAGSRVHYVDVHTPSAGRDLCSSQPWVGGFSMLYHPTSRGHQEMANILTPAISQALDDAAAQTTTTIGSTTTTTVEGPTASTTEGRVAGGTANGAP